MFGLIASHLSSTSQDLAKAKSRRLAESIEPSNVLDLTAKAHERSNMIKAKLQVVNLATDCQNEMVEDNNS